MADQFVCNTTEMREFIGAVQDAVSSNEDVGERLGAIRPLFSRILADETFLPPEFRRPVKEGGMGAGIANWLLYRDTEGALSLSALVLPPGVATPVHDHLAWGLVGLYHGEQEEEVYAPDRQPGPEDERVDLRLAETNRLHAGDFYELIPPNNDIHRVRTTGDEPSISLHLLSNDVGCVLRHRFEPDSGHVHPFRSGYTNVACES